MRHVSTAILLSLALLAGAPAPGRGEGQDDAAPRRIRLLRWNAGEDERLAEKGLRHGLALAGLDGDVAVFDARFDPGAASDTAGRARERVRAERDAREALRRWRREGMDLVVAIGTPAALIASEEVRDVPVVFTAVTHPGAAGITPRTGFGATGRNLTGCSAWVGMDRMLDLFRRAVPRLRTLAVVASDQDLVSEAEIDEARRTVREDGLPLEIVARIVHTTGELRRAVAELDPGVDALWIPSDDLCAPRVGMIRKALGERHLPLLGSSRQAVRGGACVGLVCDLELLGVTTAAVVRRILVDGVDPGTIPIRRLETCERLVNLGAEGRTLPPEIVAGADRIFPEEPAR